MQNPSPALIALEETPNRVAELPVAPPSGCAGSERAAARGDRAAEVKLRRLGLRQLDRMASLEPRVLKGGDARAIHDLRVASRRLEAVADLICPAPLPAEARKLRRQIKRSRRALSKVRDSDALLERIETLLARKRTARRKAWAVIAKHLRERRKEAFRRAKRKISRAELPAALARLREWLELETPPSLARSQAGAEPARLTAGWLQARIGKAIQEAGATFEARLGRVRERPDAPAAHKARIAAKRARYLAEILRDFGAPESAEAAAWFREVQKRLGDWHDLGLLEEAMIAVAARPGFLRDHLDRAFEIERLIVQNRRKKEELLGAFNELTAEERLRSIRERMSYVAASPPEALAKA